MPTPASTADLQRYGFLQIAAIHWDLEMRKMTVTRGGTTPPPQAGIYAFVKNDEVCRVGTTEQDLVARVIHRGTIVTKYHAGHPRPYIGRDEAEKWAERLDAHPEGGTVWARAGTQFEATGMGMIDGSLAEERYFIQHHSPYMNTGRN
jgi:hypothetical protein